MAPRGEAASRRFGPIAGPVGCEPAAPVKQSPTGERAPAAGWARGGATAAALCGSGLQAAGETDDPECAEYSPSGFGPGPEALRVVLAGSPAPWVRPRLQSPAGVLAAPEPRKRLNSGGEPAWPDPRKSLTCW